MIKNSRNNLQRCLLALSIVLTTFTLTGCWSIREPNDLAILNVIGVDKNEAGQFELTAIIAKPQNPFLQSSETEKGQELIEICTGRSLLEALSKLAVSTSKQIYVGHLQVVIFGEKAARESMKESLDFFGRESDFRPNIKLLVTKGKASEIMKSPTQLRSPLGSEILTSLRTKQLSSTDMVQNLSQFTGASSTKMKDPITGEIGLASEQGIVVEQLASAPPQLNVIREAREKGKELEKEVSATGTGKSENDQRMKTNETNAKHISDVFMIQGTAVFKNTRLIGWLDKTETRGLLWIKGKLANDVVVLNCPRNEKGTVSLRIGQKDSQLLPHMINGKPKMDISINVEGDIGQITCQNPSVSSSELEEMNRQLRGIILKEVTLTLEKVKQGWQADIFHFGESINRKYPLEWKMISSTWKSSGLKEMPVHLKVNANISRYGLRER